MHIVEHKLFYFQFHRKCQAFLSVNWKSCIVNSKMWIFQIVHSILRKILHHITSYYVNYQCLLQKLSELLTLTLHIVNPFEQFFHIFFNRAYRFMGLPQIFLQSAKFFLQACLRRSHFIQCLQYVCLTIDMLS